MQLSCCKIGSSETSKASCKLDFKVWIGLLSGVSFKSPIKTKGALLTFNSSTLFNINLSYSKNISSSFLMVHSSKFYSYLFKAIKKLDMIKRFFNKLKKSKKNLLNQLNIWTEWTVITENRSSGIFSWYWSLKFSHGTHWLISFLINLQLRFFNHSSL